MNEQTNAQFTVDLWFDGMAWGYKVSLQSSNLEDEDLEGTRATSNAAIAAISGAINRHLQKDLKA